MWLSEIQEQLKRDLIPGRISVLKTLRDAYIPYISTLLEMSHKCKHEVHLGHYDAIRNWYPDKIGGSVEKCFAEESINLIPFEGESVNWIEYNHGISVCVMYCVDGGIITVFPFYKHMLDDRWNPCIAYAIISNGQMFVKSKSAADLKRLYSIGQEDHQKRVAIKSIATGLVEEHTLKLHTAIAERAVALLECYGMLINEEWTVMGNEVLGRADKRRAINSGVDISTRKVLAVVENGVPRMVGSFKCPNCQDRGFDTVNTCVCSCNTGVRLSRTIQEQKEKREADELATKNDCVAPAAQE
jgi:hypothetical protein